MNAKFRRALSPVLIGAIIFIPFVALPAAAFPSIERAPAASAVPAGNRTADGAAEVLLPDEAINHLANLKVRKRAAFRDAERSLAGRGLKPTRVVGVVRSLSTASSKRRGTGPIRPVASDGTGEITVWAWDDGDDSTWEGLVYIERYGEGAVTFTTQIYIPDQAMRWNDPISYERFREPVILTSHRGSSRGGIQLIDRRPQEKIADWATCAFFWCLGAAVGCIVMGPLWYPCFLAGCFTALIGCAQTLFEP